jgi:branched-chain amino acid transport system ATP-binding protein
MSCDVGEVVSIVGPNGAGKTSTLMAISRAPGMTVSGSILFGGKDIGKSSPEAIASAGLSLVPETRRTFVDLTVEENLLIGAMRLSSPKDRRKAVADALDRFPTLGRIKDRPGGKLSGGEQQLLVVVRAIIGRPQLLLLDEPSLGLAPLIIRDVYELIKALIKESGIGLILVEQNALAALSLADRCIVLRSGTVEMSGNAKEMAQDQNFINAYFGVAHGH